MTNIEPTGNQFRAALEAFSEVEEELDFRWVAHKPIQGESARKVFSYRIAKAVLNCLRVAPGEKSDDLTDDEKAVAGILVWDVHPDLQARTVIETLRERGWTNGQD